MRLRQLSVVLTLHLTLTHAAVTIKLKRRRPKKGHAFNDGQVDLSVNPKPWRTITNVSFKLKPPGQKALAWINGSPNLNGIKWNYLQSNLTSSSQGTWKWKVQAKNSKGQTVKSKWRKYQVIAPPTVQPTNLPTMGPTPSPSTSPTLAPTNQPSINPSPAMPSPVNDHMRNIFKFFISYRDPRNGMWCDNLAFTDSGVCGDSGSWTYDFYSAASNGWGMISDVIFTELGLLTYEEGRARAYETITNSIQFWPKDSTYGFFKHFSNSAYGSNSEYSTIDTSILIMGSEFAGNYFGGEMRTLADQMFQNVNFQAAIDPDLKPKMYATVGETGMSGRFIAPYNEYYILAYLAQRWEGMYNNDTSYAHKYFETYVGLTGKPVGSKGFPKDVDYKGFGVLSDHGGFVASFIPQFCWYTIRAFRDNTYYSQMMENWLQAERAYWTDLDGRYDTMYTWGKNVTGKVYGSAAGDCPQSAYCVSQVGNTERNDDTWSAAIMAGFLGPITGTLRDQVNQDIDWLYENDACTYEKTYKDGSTSKVLWRCSVHPNYSNWKANRPTSVDFGTMIFGYATNFLQPEFWDMYSI